MKTNAELRVALKEITDAVERGETKTSEGLRKIAAKLWEAHQYVGKSATLRHRVEMNRKESSSSSSNFS